MIVCDPILFRQLAYRFACEKQLRPAPTPRALEVKSQGGVPDSNPRRWIHFGKDTDVQAVVRSNAGNTLNTTADNVDRLPIRGSELSQVCKRKFS